MAKLLSFDVVYFKKEVAVYTAMRRGGNADEIGARVALSVKRGLVIFKIVAGCASNYGNRMRVSF